MIDKKKTKEQLAEELEELRQRIAKFEKAETKHKKAEKDLEEEKEKFRSLFFAMKEGVCIHEIIYDESNKEVDYRIVDVNPAYESILGIQRERAKGRLASEVYGAGEPPYLDIYAKVAVSGESTSFEIYFPPMKKHFSISVFSPGKGKFATVLTDITERERMKREIEERREYLESVLLNAPDAIVTIDASHLIFEWNPGAERLFGYTRDEVLGKNIDDLIVRSDEKNQAMFLTKKVLSGKEVHPFETVRYRKDGILVNVIVAGSSIRIGDKLHGAVVVYTDITERKRAEEKIKASLKENEVLLREIHHRVKNNFQIISSLLNLQSRHINDARALEMFLESRNRVRTMALIHEKLYRSKDMARVDFSGYIESLVRHLTQIYGVGVAAVNLDMDVQDVFLDINTAIPCGLIINEVISNSLKHAFPDERKGEISIVLRSEKDGKFKLNISDNGVGLPKDLDIHNTESLGMQLITMLVDQLQGTLTLDRNQGTSFKIIFRELKYSKDV